VKFGEYTLKSGIISPIYLDLRIVVSYPDLLKNIATVLIDLSSQLTFDKIAGIPYTALPIASAFSLLSGNPMIYARKEKKAYGTGQRIEGVWNKGERVLIIDDLITTGDSKFEVFSVFQNAGLEVRDVVVLVDREQGGRQLLEKKGYQLFSAMTILEILDRMKETDQIDTTMYEKTSRFLRQERT
jgi:uridine monophosphate synthetase